MSNPSNSTSTSQIPSATTPLPTTAPNPPTSSSSSIVQSSNSIQSSSEIANSSPPIASSGDLPTTSSSTFLPTTEPTTSSSSTSTSSTSSSEPPSSSSSTSTPTSITPTTSTPSSTRETFVSTDSGGRTITEIVTSTQTPVVPTTSSTQTSSSSTATSTTGLQSDGGSSSGGLNQSGKIAVAVVVPIVAVALLVLGGLFLWRKRKARKDAEELRRKEVEEYGYNPNNDPTLPAIGGAASDGPFEMREDGSSGYRGWGTTAVASSAGRKASTTMSGPSAGGIGMAYSEGTSPSQAGGDNRSDIPLVDGSPLSGDAEALGAMGPAASTNRGDINRGPSNASSSYSAANRSDASGDIGPPGGAYYSNHYEGGNPYGETQYGSPPGRAEMPAQPIIRDVQARRNTRIENPSHFPQQSSGISQNF